jgi:hypothetical protein
LLKEYFANPIVSISAKKRTYKKSTKPKFKWNYSEILIFIGGPSSN